MKTLYTVHYRPVECRDEKLARHNVVKKLDDGSKTEGGECLAALDDLFAYGHKFISILGQF